MIQSNNKKRIRSVVRWVAWVLFVQFLLLNVSGIFYGYNLTHFYEPTEKPSTPPSSRNIFIKTWKLFTGPRFQKMVPAKLPQFHYVTVDLKTKNGTPIECWYLPVDSAKGTVILIHGLGSNKSILLDEAYEFRYSGFNVLMLDLRAHGNSGGNTCTIGFRESEEARLAYEWVQKKGEKTVFFYGISLGAVVITRAIYDYDLSPTGIILEMPFESMESLQAKRLSMLGFPEEPFGGIVTFWASVERGFNAFNQHTSRYGKKIKCRVLIQYGAFDMLVSPAETRSIFSSIASPKKKLVVYGNAGHQSLLNADPLKWKVEVNEFLTQ